jgi:hypothetical protein
MRQQPGRQRDRRLTLVGFSLTLREPMKDAMR